MAMGIQLILLGSLLLACSPPSAARAGDRGAGEGAHATTVQVGERTLELIALPRRYAGGSGEQLIELRLPNPCRFLARGSGTGPAVEDYGEAGAVALVAGPLAHEDDYARVDDRVPSDRCSHVAQAVIVLPGQVKVGPLLISALGFCAESAPDEKVYYGIAHGSEEPPQGPARS